MLHETLQREQLNRRWDMGRMLDVDDDDDDGDGDDGGNDEEDAKRLREDMRRYCWLFGLTCCLLF